MDFKTYSKQILCKVQLFLGNDYDTEIREVTKNNGLVLTGIMSRKEGMNICPTVYIDSFYNDYIDADEIEYIAKNVASSLKNAEIDNENIIDDFFNYEMAKERVVIKLINAEANKDLLFDIPHRRFHNLAVCYYYLVEDSSLSGFASVLIRNSHIMHWNITEDTLYECAYSNTKELLPFKMWNIKELIENICDYDLKDIDIPMYVISNEHKTNGSCAMLYKEYMKKISAQLDGDFYILPSSIHELVILTSKEERNNKELLDMVTLINRTQVAKEEVLADSIYYYDHELDEVIWIC